MCWVSSIETGPEYKAENYMAKYINRSVPFLAGRKLSLSLPRRFVGDLLHSAKQIPSIPMERRMDLASTVEARASWENRVSWCAIFLKAYSIVAARRPELRRTYLSFPWGHIYEHPINVASFSLERQYGGEDGVFFARIARPELIPLEVLDGIVRRHKSVDIDQVDSFRQALNLSRLPTLLRRFIWWLGLETDGRYKAKFFGTFGISVTASFGAAGLHILSPVATTINYGAFEPNGKIEVRLTYDHRVLDGATVARAMAALEDVLRNEICEELNAGPRHDQVTPADRASEETVADVSELVARVA